MSFQGMEMEDTFVLALTTFQLNFINLSGQC